jgi:threonylcarbamoyladenosine tRNA methylthiotransferase MtaB
LIVGFPGETDQDFQETVEYFRTSPLHYAHVFSYSPRYMAKSRKFPKAIIQPVIQERSQTLRQLSQRKRRMFYESQVATVQSVLFEQKKKDTWTGLTDNYVRVAVQSPEDLTNQMKGVLLQRVDNQYVVACLNPKP